jgi:hypothetical protein
MELNFSSVETIPSLNASVMNIKEFYEDNIGKAFTGILSDFARRKK